MSKPNRMLRETDDEARAVGQDLLRRARFGAPPQKVLGMEQQPAGVAYAIAREIGQHPPPLRRPSPHPSLRQRGGRVDRANARPLSDPGR